LLLLLLNLLLPRVTELGILQEVAKGGGALWSAEVARSPSCARDWELNMLPGSEQCKIHKNKK